MVNPTIAAMPSSDSISQAHSWSVRRRSPLELLAAQGLRNPRCVTQHGFCRVSSSEAKGRLSSEIDRLMEPNQDETQNPPTPRCDEMRVERTDMSIFDG